MRDEDLPELVDAAAEGIHNGDRRPFPRAWANLPAPEMGRDLASRYWKYRATFPGDEWALPLVVRSEGGIIGVQGAEASRFPILRDTRHLLVADTVRSGARRRHRDR